MKREREREREKKDIVSLWGSKNKMKIASTRQINIKEIVSVVIRSEQIWAGQNVTERGKRMPNILIMSQSLFFLYNYHLLSDENNNLSPEMRTFSRTKGVVSLWESKNNKDQFM